jgi:hypothetical protein
MPQSSIVRIASSAVAWACFVGTLPVQATTLVGNDYANGSESFLISATFSPVVNPVNAGAFTGTLGAIRFCFGAPICCAPFLLAKPTTTLRASIPLGIGLLGMILVARPADETST